jgi:hypothetical protein
MKCRCNESAFCIPGIGACFCAIGTAEVADAVRPAAVICEEKPHVVDFGPREGCHHAPSPHNQRVYITSLGGVGTSSTPVMLASVSVIDFDHAGHVEPWRPTSSFEPSTNLTSADSTSPVEEARKKSQRAWLLIHGEGDRRG